MNVWVKSFANLFTRDKIHSIQTKRMSTTNLGVT